jgi:hypothetical protein
VIEYWNVVPPVSNWTQPLAYPSECPFPVTWMPTGIWVPQAACAGEAVMTAPAVMARTAAKATRTRRRRFVRMVLLASKIIEHHRCDDLQSLLQSDHIGQSSERMTVPPNGNR